MQRGDGNLGDSSASTRRQRLRSALNLGDFDAVRSIVKDCGHAPSAQAPGLLAALAVAYIQLKDFEITARTLEKLAAAELPDWAARADYGLVLLMLDRPKLARPLLEAATQDPAAGPEAFGRLGAVALAEDDLNVAEWAYDQAIQRDPNRAELCSNLGGVYFRQGKYTEAVQQYDRALALQAELTPPREMRARALLLLDRGQDLVAEAQAACNADPELPENHLRLAMAQRRVEDRKAAEETLDAAIDRFPDRADLKRAYILVLRERQRHGALGLRLKRWVDEQEFEQPDWLTLELNRTRIDARFLKAAEESLNAIQDQEIAESAEYGVLQARLILEEARAEEAVRLLQATLERFPGHVEARQLLAHTLTSLGRMEEAKQYTVESSPINPLYVANKVEAQEDRASDVEVKNLEGLLADRSLLSDQRARVGFTLARAYDRRGEYEAAFRALERANALVREHLTYDWRRHRSFTDRQLRTFTEAWRDEIDSRTGSDTRRPIFVVGMPRSGTTLTEQILCSHPKVYGAGELNWIPHVRGLMRKVVDGKPYPEAMATITQRSLRHAAEYYLEKVAELDEQSPHFVDKLPHNFDNIGMIAPMFPNAAIVHVRREPRDIAISNYFQNYAAAQGLMGFAYDLRDIGHMLNDHDRIMRHWHEMFPGRILELNYEEFVAEPEVNIRRLLDFCGLEWDDRVMNFYETQRPVRTASVRQVRSGIYQTSAQKWRRYEEFLAPLEELLEQGYRALDESYYDLTA